MLPSIRPPRGSPTADLTHRLRSALADRYTLERELGRGGMATVWLAHDLKHDRRVAIKVLRPEVAQALGPDRFLREIELTARLNHPHILPLLDSGTAPGLFYYVMPYVEGESLRDRLYREKQLPLDDALQIAREVADALSYAHSHDVIHRDIKPENILLESGHAVVADFGVAAALTAAGGERLTETGLTVGTPAYMSPEQAGAAREIDGRSDLYSLATVLYELLAGDPPFTATTPQAVLARKSVDPVPRLRTVRETVPEALEQVIARALARVPADRYATAAEFVAALEVDVEAHQRRQRVQRALRRIGVAVAVALVIGAGAIAWTRLRSGTAWKKQPVSGSVVAVMPFRATTTDPTMTDLGEMIMDLLFAVLTGDVAPRAVETGSLLRKWNDMTVRGQATTSDAPLKLAAYFGAGLLLEGGVVQTGPQLTVNAVLRRVPEGTEVARATVVDSVDHLGAVPHLLVVRLLGDQLGEGAERVESLADQDPDAVKAYLAGVRAYRSGAYRVAVEHYSRALARDSTFALAALNVGRALGADVDVDQNTEPALRLAQRLSDRLGTRDRAALDALLAEYSGATISQQFASAARWVALSPDDPEAQLNYAFYLRSAGPPLAMADWATREARAWETAWRLDSVTPALLAQQLRWAAHVGDLERVRRMGVQYLALADTTTDWWPAHRWTIAIAQADSATVRALRARAATRDPRVATRRTAWQLTVLGIAAGLSLDDAELVMRQAAAAATTAADSAAALSMYPILALALGREGDAVAQMANPRLSWLVSLDTFRAPLTWIWTLDLWLMYPGLDDAAAAASDSLRGWVAAGRKLPRGAALPSWGGYRGEARCYPLVYRAARGDTMGVRTASARAETEATDDPRRLICPLLVAALLESLDQTRTATPALDALEVAERAAASLPPHLPLVARLRRERGQWDRALAAARARFAGAAQDFHVFTPHLREEGYAAAAAGDTAAAIRAFAHYLALKTHPDPGPATRERDEVRAILHRITRASSRR